MEEEASLRGYARGNVAAGGGVLSSAEQGATNPRRTRSLADPPPRPPVELNTRAVAKYDDQTGGQPQRAQIKGTVANRKVPLGTNSKGAKGVEQLPVASQTFLKRNGDYLATNQRSIFPTEMTAKGAKGMEQLPVASQTLLKSNGDYLATKQSSIFPTEMTAKGAKGMEQLPVASQTLLQSNGDYLSTKQSSIFPTEMSAKGAKGEEQLPVASQTFL